MGDVPQAGKQHAGPIIDEDGFQLVQRSRGRESEVKKADFMSFSQQIAGKLNCSCCVTQPSNF